MAKFTKNILKVGDYNSPDGKLRVTPESIRHFAAEFSRMKGAKLAVPMAWAHPQKFADSLPVAAPKDRRRPPEDTVGYLTDVKAAKDGRSVDIEISVPRNVDAEKVKADLAFVSPVVLDKFRDGGGNDYTNCISHMDLVQHPVDTGQSQFQPVATACALRMSLLAEPQAKPKYYRLADDSPFDKDKKRDGEGDRDETNETEAETEEIAPGESESTSDVVPDNPGDGVDETNETGGDGDETFNLDEIDGDDGTQEEEVVDEAGRLGEVIESLAVMKIVLPEGTNPINFLERLHSALLTSAAITGEDEMGIQTGTQGLETESPVIAAMSLKVDAAHEYASTIHRDGIRKRLSTLLKTGRCTPHEAKERESNVGAVRLSLVEGKPAVGRLEHWIASREACPAGTFWEPARKIQMAGLTVENPPSELGGQMSDEEADDVADEVLGVSKAAAK